MAWPNDGPGWSPDCGDFWVKNRVIYFADGETYDPKPGEIFAMRTGDPGRPCEDFSAWTDEKRAAVQAEYAERRRVAQEQRTSAYQKRKDAGEAVLAKLTADEREALEEFFDDLRS